MNLMKRLLCVTAAATMILSLVLMTSCNKKPVYSNDQRIEFPVEKSLTITWWYPYGDDYYTGDFQKLDDHPFMKYMEEKSNVHIEFVTPTTEKVTDELNTLIASDDMPDMVTYNWASPSYEGSTIDSVIEEELYQQLNPFVDVQMENFNKMREEYAVIDKIIVTQQNNIIWLPKVNHLDDYLNPALTSGMVVRKDYLDEVQLSFSDGGDLPVTMADWELMLDAFKVKLGIQNPLAQNIGFWCTFPNDLFLTSWNCKIETYRDPETGEARYGAIEDGTYEYVKTMRKWVENGWLVNTSITTEDKLADRYVGSWYGSADEVANLKSQAADPNFELVGVPDPVQNVGDKIVMRESYMPVGCKALDSVYVSYSCENGPLVCRWMDEFYTTESYNRTSYGVEGEDYTRDAEGNVVFTDKIKNNPDGLRYGIYQNAFVESFYCDSYVVMNYVYEGNAKKAIEEWSKSSCEFSYIDRLCLSYTEEENEILDRCSGIWLPVSSQTSQMVRGELELSEWENYVATIRESGIDEYISVMQSAWDRFLAS